MRCTAMLAIIFFHTSVNGQPSEQQRTYILAERFRDSKTFFRHYRDYEDAQITSGHLEHGVYEACEKCAFALLSKQRKADCYFNAADMVISREKPQRECVRASKVILDCAAADPRVIKFREAQSRQWAMALRLRFLLGKEASSGLITEEWAR